MSLALLSTDPVTPTLFTEWSFSHMAHHQDIARRIYELYGRALPLFVIDPVDPRDPEAMLQNHQTMHNNQNAVLGIDGNDLLSVDFGDREQRAAWIFLNFSEHQQANQILGV